MGSSSGGTLRDVAAAAGVSASTASRVLNGGKPVSADLAERVRSAAVRVGYSPHRIAQALRGRTDTISVIVDDPTTPTIAETVIAMQAEAHLTGAVVTVAAAGNHPQQQVTSARALAALRPRAVVLTGAWLRDPALSEQLRSVLNEYERRGGHVVVVGSSLLPYPAITFDDHGMGIQMATHIAALDNRSILILAGPENHPAMAARTLGIRDGLALAGFAGTVEVEHSALSRESAAEALGRHDCLARPATVMTVSDVLALGAMAELTRQGATIPSEVAVTGIDDIPIARDLDPGLTTMALPFDQVGRAALRLALDPGAISGDNLIIHGRLVQRASTAR